MYLSLVDFCIVSTWVLVASKQSTSPLYAHSSSCLCRIVTPTSVPICSYVKPHAEIRCMLAALRGTGDNTREVEEGDGIV